MSLYRYNIPGRSNRYIIRIVKRSYIIPSVYYTKTKKTVFYTENPKTKTYIIRKIVYYTENLPVYNSVYYTNYIGKIHSGNFGYTIGILYQRYIIRGKIDWYNIHMENLVYYTRIEPRYIIRKIASCNSGIIYAEILRYIIRKKQSEQKRYNILIIIYD